VISSIVLVTGTSELQADSLWRSSARGGAGLYSSSQRRIGVGDVVTIRISESTSAVQEASTRTQKESQLNTDLLSAWDQVANVLGSETLRKQYEVGIRGDDEYSGAGQTSRRSTFKTIVTGIVTEILENGNLFVIAEHELKINQEIQTIRLSGIIRPADIEIDNSVHSHQIAKAEISINGAGIVGSKQTPGMLTKMFNWLF
jgi:flagellar L-ring protein precursor FlgH